ncbi:MAG: flagellar hook protein FlgE [Pseudomonadota bacterium]
MPFNTALSGLRAAATDLEITGNNIANSATNGFKSSRAEFADIYAASFVSGGNGVGSGVVVQKVAQQFAQGTVSFTDNALDLAINGGGFFVLDDDGAPAYSRAGIFSINEDGFVVNNAGMRLQGLLADAEGRISGEPTDLLLNTRDIAPKSTTRVNETFNLDASAPILEEQTNTITSSGPAVQTVQLGSDNGYTAGTVDFNGSTQNIPSADNLPAVQIAAELTALPGISASASTTATLAVDSGYPVGVNELLVNGSNYTGNNVNELINNISSASGLSASLNADGTSIDIIATTGADLEFDVSGSVGSAVQLSVSTASGTVTIDESNPAQQQATVGGVVSITIDDLSELNNATASNVFGPLTPIGNPPSNTFDPANPDSYNSVTSFTIFDTSGISHNVVQYFVRVPNRLGEPEGNLWNTVIQIDGRDVGGSDPDNPTRASFELRFNADGSFDPAGSEQVIIDNWQPRNADGTTNGALGPLSPGVFPIPEPPTSSNFLIDVSNATAFGGAFAFSTLNQNGFAKGSLTGVEVAESGTIFARYSNGETQSLGQLQLASFPNVGGLTPLGDSVWGDSIDSGQPILGIPASGQFGVIQAGALEDSNVDLTEQLVNLILAQRNFQANSKTIETADSVTQTIINLR